MSQTNSFATKGPFDDLEINTLDEVKLYCSKGWLYQVSPYFKALLTSGFSESKDCIIKLSYRSQTIIYLFLCINAGCSIFRIYDHFRQIKNKDDLCDLLSACDEYQLTNIKKQADIFFSKNDILPSFLSTEIISIVYLLKMELMEKNICELLKTNTKLFDSLDFKIMDCEILNFFTAWPAFFECLNRWTSVNTITDKILKQSKILDYDFTKMSKENIGTLTKIIRKCHQAPKYRTHILMKLSYLSYPPDSVNDIDYQSLNFPPDLNDDHFTNSNDDLDN